ncbi:DNA-formamidopyrimidine glycosylase family protein [Microbacterium sediminicola]|uniref:DNA-formamidopyrimidine glycosylase family protein n=1 Tax=Microbacterium sediminicola TaxID=415210 RepID=UPI0031D6A14B
MPEGDTVWRAAHRLDEALAGDTTTRVDLRVPRLATADLSGKLIDSCVPRGKHLLLRIGGWTLHSHLKMEGEWHVYRPGERWRVPAFRARAVVETSRTQAVGFDLADLALVPTERERELVGHLGPDPLSDRWDLDEAARRVGADARGVHVALLDQRNVAGFGNVYANEMLFVRGIRPSAAATDIDARALVDTGARMIRTNLHRVERTFTGDSRRGRRTWVYGRENQPCRRCGTPVRAGALGAGATRERNVFWCPRCQP